MRTRFAASRDGFRWPNWLRRGLLAAALCVVVLGVVGMHQLSFGHSLATPPAADSHEHGATHPHAVHNQAAEHATAGGVQDKQANAGRRISERAATWGGSSSGGGDACPGCGQHSMAFSACLLALTLLVLTWLLTPPQVRHLPPRWRWQPATVAVLAGRPLPAMSLTELSILRT